MPLAEGRPCGLATASMILGIVSLTCLGIFAGIPAIILGVIAGKKIKNAQGVLTGEGKAKAGIICGIISIVLTIMIAAVIVLFLVFERQKIEEVTAIIY